MRWPVITLALLLAAFAAASSVAGDLSYNKDIRPILVENCFSCHGADSASRQANLRLDRRDEAVESGAIAPGDPDSSVMLDRIFSDDPEEVMPPPALKKTLTAEQKELLKRWIAEGSEYEPHWSFIPPKRPDPPAVKHEAWVKNPIDQFILARLEAAERAIRSGLGLTTTETAWILGVRPGSSPITRAGITATRTGWNCWRLESAGSADSAD
jgi:hypothetical protein